MDGRIAHLRSHYRIQGARVVPGLASRLDRVLRQRVVECYEEALQKALADDEGVYVLRRVEASMTLMLGEGATDTALARSWGTHLAGAVVGAIAKGEQDPGNLVRFENHADYVAHFLVALLKGNQRGQWFYGAFAELSALDKGSAISRALLDNRDHLPAILRYVNRYGELDSLISALDAETKQALWSAESEHRYDLEVSRSLFIVALQFVDGLEAWARMPRDGEDLFRDYLGTAPPVADWRDPRSLAVSVFEVLRFLFVRGYLARPQAQPGEFLSRLSKTLEDFEWLDREWLKASLMDLFEKEEQRTADLPLRMLSGRATPRQRELLSTLAELLRDGTVLGGNGTDAVADALRLFALLVTNAPLWADDAAAKVMIDNLLMARTALQEATSPAEFVRRLQCRDVEGALRLLPLDTRERATGACRLVVRLGEPALALVEKLSGETSATAMTVGIESNCAGLSLLLRAVLDARLHALPDEANYLPKGELPRPVMLFLSVALRLCGEAAVVDGRLDEGLCLLAGLKERLPLDTLRAHWSEAKAPGLALFQNALLGVAAGQRLVQPVIMHVFRSDLDDGKRALVAGDESASLWLLGRFTETDAEVEAAILDWLAVWEEVTGVRPSLYTGNSGLCSILRTRPDVTLLPETDELQATHDSGRKALLAAFEVLEQGQLGWPEVDLTLTIVACILLRTWVRWLRGFSSSGVPYMVENFVRRPGRLHADANGLVVELEGRGLDVILEMAGYLKDLEQVPWIPGGRVRFRLRGA